MKLPRDISASELIKLLKDFGYNISRQKGSHIRLTTKLNGEHHLTIPNHESIKLGTLSSIINDVAIHFNQSKEAVSEKLFN
ncbi:MAG TPA: type II toxin-antitoxin system HicA family toxin [Puia sp.]|jgi:predicted RNA binding protein YcfA (HicA-like mRNA interferase family)|nr:type II toxin-antitoxin system HicA family toxin [Puia sp.]